MSNIESRLESLERAARRWKLLSVAVLVVGAGWGLLAAASKDVPDVVRCRELQVVNDKGVVIAQIEDLPKAAGGAGGWMTCYGDDGTRKLQMGAQVGGDAQLRVMSGTDNSDGYLTLSASPEGGGLITLDGANQAPHIRIAAAPGKAGEISLTDASGKALWHAGP